jgi:hypothetical protein
MEFLFRKIFENGDEKEIFDYIQDKKYIFRLNLFKTDFYNVEINLISIFTS